jgi:hypothetical protein
MAERLSQIPAGKVRKAPRATGARWCRDSCGLLCCAAAANNELAGQARAALKYDRLRSIALEKFNPFSPHQTQLRNFAATYGMQTKPSRWDPGRVAHAFSEVRM